MLARPIVEKGPDVFQRFTSLRPGTGRTPETRQAMVWPIFETVTPAPPAFENVGRNDVVSPAAACIAAWAGGLEAKRQHCPADLAGFEVDKEAGLYYAIQGSDGCGCAARGDYERIMNTGAYSRGLAIPELLRADPQQVGAWTRRWDARHIAGQVGLIVLGAGLYGGAMGWWRDPQQALYTAIKFPLIILLVTAGNGLLNSMLAPLLGLNIPFRQSLVSILMSFAIASVILGSFSPLVAFLAWNASPISNLAASGSTYSVIMLTHVAVIAFAGVAANVRLWGLLRESGGSRMAANRVLIAWLSINLFLGSQLSWIFRPFIGAPGLELQFFREHPLAGNFYEAVYRSMAHLLNFD